MSDVNLQAAVSNDVGEGAGGADEGDGKKPRTGSTRLSSRGTAARSGRSVTDSSGTARQSHSDDTDVHSSGNDSPERECDGHAGQEASTCSSNNGKDSAIEATESKSSNSHSPSPPSSSAAYSLLSGSSEQDQPSTSGCSSDQSARLRTQKELLKALHELKIRVPAEQRGKGRSSTLASLQYALNCVKQVRANQEYYHQWSVEENHGCCLDLSAFTVEELDNITSEYALQNTDTFSVAVSFLSGKVVYISPQASSLLRCKPEVLQGAVFSELLAPQDVSTFYSSTAPCRLPPWASCTGTDSPVDCAQEKSMFCRISGERESGGELKFYPFRLTPYRLILRDSDTSQPEPCCLLITERVHSGYEAPRIPADKRIFTTSHTPSCLFQEIDERAVPLLGYLPQDLVGTPLMLYLHPEDRSLMVDIHKKIIQYAGQPIDHTPLRMCARSGEYLTMDTSWSSFVNPWSRKVAFIVGRHKVRTSPLNEDVFTAPEEEEVRPMSPEVPQLSEQIHKLLVQPVYSGGSQGYSSLGSSGSRELHPSAASSSDSTGAAAEEPPHANKLTFQQMCKDAHMLKTSGQHVYTESRNRPAPRKQASSGDVVKAAEAESTSRESQQMVTLGPKAQASTQLPRKELPAAYSYQQINCLDSIIRYLESCKVPNTVKRKCGSSSCTTSSTSDDDRRREAAGPAKDIVETLEVAGGSKVVPAEPTHPLTPLALHYKAESVVSVTSQCSFSSTIVHVGDKKPPESDIVMMEEPPTTPTPAPSIAAPQNPTASPTGVTAQPAASPSPAEKEKDKEGRRGGGGVSRWGLTKEVLSTHTQQEEQAFLNRFRDLSQLRLIQSSPTEHRQTATPAAKGVRSSKDYPAGGGSGRRRGRGGKRLKHQVEGSFPDSPALSTSGPSMPPRSTADGPSIPVFPSSQHLSAGAQSSSSPWPTSVGSQASGPPVMTSYPPGCTPFYSLYPPFPVPQVEVDPRMQAAFSCPQPGPRFPVQGSQMFPSVAPPVMAFILPNCMFPQLSGPNAPVQQLGQAVPLPTQLNPQFNPALSQISPAVANFNPTLGQFNPLVPQLNPTQPLALPPQFYNPNLMFGFQNGAAVPAPPPPAAPPVRGPSRSSTPQSTGQTAPDREGAGSPLFHSRCSSPLNLLQLEELPSNRTDVTQQTPPPGGGATQAAQGTGTCSSAKDATSEEAEVNESNQDAMSTSSDLLDLLLQEDSRSGTGSAASGSGSSGSGSGSSGSGSNGCSTSGSGTRSSNTSKYFGSIDSSENDHGHKQASGGASGEEQFIKYVLQDPIWLLMANTDEKVMMTYQMPKRDREAVLREDREVMKTAQMQQPHFTEEQKKELSQVHPWIQTGCLPKAINITSCRGCGSPTEALSAPPFDVELHDMDLTRILRDESNHITTVTADSALPDSPQSSETAHREAPADTRNTHALDEAVKEAEVTSSSSSSVDVKQD